MSIPVLKMATVGILPSPLKALYYRATGAKIGKRVKFGLLSVLSAPNIEIDDDTKIGLMTFITARSSIKLGKRVAINSMVAIDLNVLEVGDDTVIMEQCVVGGMQTPRSSLTIGKRVKVFPFCFINPTEPIHIGDDVGVGGSTYIFTHGTWKNVLDGYPAAFGPVTIDRGVWLPWRVFIMPGVHIGADTIVGANSTLTKDVPADALSRGTPAKSSAYAVTPLAPPARLEKLKEIMTDFAEYAEHMGAACSISQTSDTHFTISHNNKTALFCLNADAHEQLNKDVVISVEGISADMRADLEARNVIWFDLKANEARFSRLEIALQIYDFLGRYGIRFARD